MPCCLRLLAIREAPSTSLMVFPLVTDLNFSREIMHRWQGRERALLSDVRYSRATAPCVRALLAQNRHAGAITACLPLGESCCKSRNLHTSVSGGWFDPLRASQRRRWEAVE